jgi:uncharacterized membrane protein
MQAQSGSQPFPVILEPGVISSYSNGWKQLWKHFLELFLIGVIIVALSAGSWILGLIPYLGPILSILYGIFFLNPLNYGQKFAYFKASRGDKVEVQDMFTVFSNYWNAVGAYVVTTLIVGFGLILLIVPGIFLACKLAFVPYLVVDKKLGATEAIRASWNLTKGHGWKVFLIGLLAIPIVIAGLICLIVGVIVSAMWIQTAMASLYNAVSIEKAMGQTSMSSPILPA